MRTILSGLALLLVSASAQAQEARGDQDIVREIERGYYFKANLGVTPYLTLKVPGTGSPLLSPVLTTLLGIGSDVIDRERFSAAWEVQLGQSLHNGPKLEEVGFLDPTTFIQGDIHTFTFTAAGEVSTYLTRRFGIGVRAGGGVALMPLLMNEQYYTEQIVSQWGAASALHEGPLPMVFGGPTIEYYTKLSHFSVGVDADVAYVIGFDLGVTPSGYLKYTF